MGCNTLDIFPYQLFYISRVGNMIAKSAVLSVERSKRYIAHTKTKVSCYCKYFG